MNNVIQPAHAPMPTMSSALASRMPWIVVKATAAAAILCVAMIETAGRPDWWSGFGAASIVAVSGAILSIVILTRVSGVRLDTAVTYFMGASAARMAVSLIGLIVAVKVFKTPAEPTGFMICGYYAATLIAETVLIVRTTRTAVTITGDRNA